MFPVQALRFRLRHRAPGQFQTYSYTLPDRYPWLFGFAREHLASHKELRILSFGCSREEVFTLHRYFPQAVIIKGIDIDSRNIAACRQRAGSESTVLRFETAATTFDEPTSFYDAIFCLGVLCLSDLTALGLRRSDPYLRFEEFERTVNDLSRCLKPDGLLILHGANFRFCDTAVSRDFDVVLEAESHRDSASKFGMDNRLLTGTPYRAVVFRKIKGCR